MCLNYRACEGPGGALIAEARRDKAATRDAIQERTQEYMTEVMTDVPESQGLCLTRGVGTRSKFEGKCGSV